MPYSSFSKKAWRHLPSNTGCCGCKCAYRENNVQSITLRILAKIPVESLMEGVASQNVRFRPCVACCVCNIYQLSCNYIWYYIQTKFRGEFCGTMLLQIREYRRLNCQKMSELDDSSDNCWIVIVGDNKAKNSGKRIAHWIFRKIWINKWFKLTCCESLAFKVLAFWHT